MIFQGGLFESTHYDENDVQTISHKCNVLNLSDFQEYLSEDGSRLRNLYENNDHFYLAGRYDPVEKTLKLMPGVPSEKKKKQQTIRE